MDHLIGVLAIELGMSEKNRPYINLGFDGAPSLED